MFQLDNGLKIFYELKYTPRQEQIDTVNFIKKSINSGNKYILCDIPTGVGKSYINVMFINWYLNYIDENATFDLLTNSKFLQEQYMNEFKFINNLKGQSNYKCDCHDTTCAEGKELNRILKRPCSDCPYDNAKMGWLAGQVTLTNFHYFNTLALYQKETFDSKRKNVLIIDEAHSYESVFNDYLSFKLSARGFKRCGFTDKRIEELDNKILHIKSLSSIINFIKDDYKFELTKLVNDFEYKVEQLKGNKKIEFIRYINNINSALSSINKIIESYDNDNSNWVLDISQNKKEKFFSGIELTIQPIWCHEFLKKTIWDKYDTIIFMSGTILDKDEFCYINGLDVDETKYITLESPFDKKSRPVYYFKNIGKMTFNSKEETFKNQLPIIRKILKKYENQKGIIHTTNYEIVEWLKQNIDNDRLIYHDSETKEDAILKHFKNDSNTVLVSPSMTTGLDLKDDLARFQIILKIPYPNISSQKVKARMNSNKKWFNLETTMTLLQSYGRIVRNVEDSGDTYILDGSFSSVIQQSFNILPKYFTEAIKVIN